MNPASWEEPTQTLNATTLLPASTTGRIKPLTHETLQSTLKPQTTPRRLHFAEFQMQNEVGLDFLSYIF